VWRPDGRESGDDDRPGCVLRIAEATPRSETDAFLLALARARADAVLTSGSNLRAETGLRLDEPGRPDLAPVLERWRRAELAKTEPPVVAVLTRAREGDLDWEHPIWAAGGWVVTGADAAPTTLAEARARGIRVEQLARAGPREAVEHLTARCGLRDIDVELGPSASAALYQPPIAIDELWISTYLEPGLAAELQGGAFLSPRALRSLLGEPVATAVRSEVSGRWSYARYRRSEERT
jgi:hypothetical protein